MTVFLRLFQKIEEGEALKNSFYIARITLISIADKDTTKIIKIKKIGSLYKISTN